MGVNRGMSAAEDEVRKLVEDWASAVRKRDLPAILRNHSVDILMFDVPPPFQSRGIGAYAKTLGAVLLGWADDPTEFDIKEMQVTADADVAFAAAAMKCAGREGEGGRVEIDFRLTIGLRKLDGQWIIVHEHHSVPADK